jgi:hypothetical protein
MRHCTVSMVGKDGEQHALQTDARSLMQAAYAGVEAWAKFWWFSSDGVVEVRCGADVWRVKASRASAWYSERFPKRRDAQ